MPTRPLIPTRHAQARWFERAPRCVRTHAAWRTACATARPCGHTPGGAVVYRALGMALIVRDRTIVTVVPWDAVRFARAPAGA